MNAILCFLVRVYIKWSFTYAHKKNKHHQRFHFIILRKQVRENDGDDALFYDAVRTPFIESNLHHVWFLLAYKQRRLNNFVVLFVAASLHVGFMFCVLTAYALLSLAYILSKPMYFFPFLTFATPPKISPLEALENGPQFQLCEFLIWDRILVSPNQSTELFWCLQPLCVNFRYFKCAKFVRIQKYREWAHCQYLCQTLRVIFAIQRKDFNILFYSKCLMFYENYKYIQRIIPLSAALSNIAF